MDQPIPIEQKDDRNHSSNGWFSFDGKCIVRMEIIIVMTIIVEINNYYNVNDEDGSREFRVLLCCDFSSINDIAEKR